MGKRCVLVGCAVAVGLAAVAIDDGIAQVTKGKSRPAATAQIMSGLVQPNCAALGKGLKDAPADDKAWKAVAVNAALLNEASYILMDDGRCPDATWAGAAKTLRECSAVVLDKINAKDAAGAQAAFAQLTKACGACHTAHRQKSK